MTWCATSSPRLSRVAGTVNQVAATNMVDDQVGLRGVDAGAAAGAGPPVDGRIQEVFDLFVGGRVVETAGFGEVVTGVNAMDLERVAGIRPQNLRDPDLHPGHDPCAAINPADDLAHVRIPLLRFGLRQRCWGRPLAHAARPGTRMFRVSFV